MGGVGPQADWQGCGLTSDRPSWPPAPRLPCRALTADLAPGLAPCAATLAGSARPASTASAGSTNAIMHNFLRITTTRFWFAIPFRPANRPRHRPPAGYSSIISMLARGTTAACRPRTPLPARAPGLALHDLQLGDEPLARAPAGRSTARGCSAPGSPVCVPMFSCMCCFLALSLSVSWTRDDHLRADHAGADLRRAGDAGAAALALLQQRESLSAMLILPKPSVITSVSPSCSAPVIATPRS